MVNNETWEQLIMLREMTRRTGALHEAQVLQLKLWPRMVFQTSLKSQFSINLPERVIVFDIFTGKRKVADTSVKVVGTHAECATILDEYVKALLGLGWDVTVNVRSQKGPRKQFNFPGRVDPNDRPAPKTSIDDYDFHRGKRPDAP